MIIGIVPKHRWCLSFSSSVLLVLILLVIAPLLAAEGEDSKDDNNGGVPKDGLNHTLLSLNVLPPSLHSVEILRLQDEDGQNLRRHARGKKGGWGYSQQFHMDVKPSKKKKGGGLIYGIKNIVESVVPIKIKIAQTVKVKDEGHHHHHHYGSYGGGGGDDGGGGGGGGFGQYDDLDQEEDDISDETAEEEEDKRSVESHQQEGEGPVLVPIVHTVVPIPIIRNKIAEARPKYKVVHRKKYVKQVSTPEVVQSDRNLTIFERIYIHASKTIN